MEIVIAQNKKDIEQLEDVIQKGQQTFVEVGHALMEIRDRGLYRDVLGYETFEQYCKERWEFNRAHAYRLIDSAKVIENVSPIGDIKPTTESQARPLTKLEPQQQQVAWEKAVQTAPDGKVTAAHVSKIVKGMTNQEPPAKPTQPIINNKESVSKSFQSAFDMMVVEIKNARAMKWKETSHKAAIEMMQILLTITEQ
jgi:hypothetical protein